MHAVMPELVSSANGIKQCQRFGRQQHEAINSSG